MPPSNAASSSSRHKLFHSSLRRKPAKAAVQPPEPATDREIVARDRTGALVFDLDYSQLGDSVKRRDAAMAKPLESDEPRMGASTAMDWERKSKRAQLSDYEKHVLAAKAWVDSARQDEWMFGSD